MIDLSQTKLPPFEHQRIGIQKIVDNLWFFNTDEMGLGKTKQAIDAAQVLYQQGKIDRVLVICPAAVRDVWYDPELGELKKHLWDTIPSKVHEYHVKIRIWKHGVVGNRDTEYLSWMITNYEFISAKMRLTHLMPFCNIKTLLILDESTAISHHNSHRTKHCLQLRRACGRVLLMNGTPISETPMDLFAQANLMHPSVLQCKFISHFKNEYTEQQPVKKRDGKILLTPYGAPVTERTGWKNLDQLQAKMAPFVIRRLKKDCLDLPPVLDPVTYGVTLTEETWRIYREMRDEMVVWLGSGVVATSRQAVTKRIRLAQILSGFLGGIENSGTEEVYNPLTGFDEIVENDVAPMPLQEIGREKLDFFIAEYAKWLAADKNLKIVVWVQFRAELERMMRELPFLFPDVVVSCIHGGQSREDRHAALRLLDPRTAPVGPVLMVGTYGTGSLGLNFTACHVVVNMSYDDSLYKALQSAARFDRPGQTEPISTFDIVAKGPKGQKTLDYIRVKSRREKLDLATWTTDHWVYELNQE